MQKFERRWKGNAPLELGRDIILPNLDIMSHVVSKRVYPIYFYLITLTIRHDWIRKTSFNNILETK